MRLDEKLYNALKASLELQSHYATLLNQYDGGRRMTFDSVEAWVRRLHEIEVMKAKENAKAR